MKSDLYIEGYWWLPEDPENKIAGILHYKPEKELELKLFGDFGPDEDFILKYSNSERSAPDTIFGEDQDANMITLFVLSFGKRYRNFSSLFPLIHYKVRYCIKGAHISSKDENIFDQIEVELELLTHWINSYPFRVSIPIKDNKLTEGFTISYSGLESSQPFDINDGFELSLNARAAYTDIYEEEITIRQRYVASIKSKERASFSNLLQKCYRFRWFLNMATLKDNSFLALRLYSDQYFRKLLNTEKIPTPIEIFFKETGEEKESNKFVNNFRSLFLYKDIEDILPEILKKWFAFDNNMVPILHHLNDSIKKKPIFSSVDFLIIVQALEGYHHRFFDREPEKKKSIESRLINLRNHFTKDVLIVREIDMSLVANSRNYYSHFYSKSSMIQIADGSTLFHLTRKLRHLLICCFLHEIGVDNIKINNILQKNNQH